MTIDVQCGLRYNKRVLTVIYNVGGFYIVVIHKALLAKLIALVMLAQSNETMYMCLFPDHTINLEHTLIVRVFIPQLGLPNIQYVLL